MARGRGRCTESRQEGSPRFLWLWSKFTQPRKSLLPGNVFGGRGTDDAATEIEEVAEPLRNSDWIVYLRAKFCPISVFLPNSVLFAFNFTSEALLHDGSACARWLPRCLSAACLPDIEGENWDNQYFNAFAAPPTERSLRASEKCLGYNTISLEEQLVQSI